MKIRNLFMFLALVTASIAYSTSAQAAQAAAEKQKTEATSEKGRTVDISKVSLREGTHEVYRDKQSGIIVSRVVKNGEVVRYLAADKNGKRVAIPSCSICRGDCCYGSGTHRFCLITHSSTCDIKE